MKRIVLLTSICLLMTIHVEAQKSKKKNAPASTAEAPKESKDESKKKWDELTSKSRLWDGLFPIYRDTLTGKVYLTISADQLTKEFIYFSHVEDGLAEIGLQKGAYRGSKVICFQRNYERLDIIHVNTAFYYDPQNALSKSAGANINNPVLASMKIEGEDKKSGKLLIDGSALFISEDFSQIRRPSNGEGGSKSGTLSKEKSAITAINNYPENSELTVRFVYDSSNPSLAGDNIADGRSISILYQHSILQMPELGFEPRADDPRVGYFSTKVNDMTTFGPMNYKDMIHRWRLEKKNPELEISEPIKPITWWVENTTPVEFRPLVKAAVETWNQAFEKIGFKNAVVCHIQPDDAQWDAGDIRYNVIRWTSSPKPPFGGYGPSFVNPRTGEILGADIMIELSSITNRVLREQMFLPDGGSGSEHDAQQCLAGAHLNHSMHLAAATMRAFNFKNIAEKDFVHQFLQRLILHEVGHTLGLQHNMRASSIHSPAKLKDPEFVAKYNLTNSVMEYPAIHFGLAETSKPVFFDSRPGVYDMWAIEYGYSPGHSDPMMESLRMRNITDRSDDPLLVFGNDADDMRGNTGIDPHINIYDLSSDPVAYASERCDLINSLLPGLKENFTHSGYSYHELRNAYQVLMNEYAIQVKIMSRTVGGVHINRAFPGQASVEPAFKPVARVKQKEAMAALSKYAFAPEAFAAPAELYSHLMQQRRGFEHGGDTEDPKIFENILVAQKTVLDHFFNPLVSSRMINSELYGSTYSLDEMMKDLYTAVFLADMNGKVNPHRKSLQVTYMQYLVDCLDSKREYSEVMRGMAVFQLNKVLDLIKTAPGSDEATKAHRQYLKLMAEKVLKS